MWQDKVKYFEITILTINSSGSGISVGLTQKGGSLQGAPAVAVAQDIELTLHKYVCQIITNNTHVPRRVY